jgi:hypothetical protein
MNKLLASIIFFGVVLSAFVAAAPVKVTNTGESYGHHGSCGAWNGCQDAAHCALMVCQVNGFSSVVSYTEGLCQAGGYSSCHLFSNPTTVDCGWNMHCEIPVVSDVWCDNGQFVGACIADLPPQEGGNNGGDVPEFGALTAFLVITVAGVFVWRRHDE